MTATDSKKKEFTRKDEKKTFFVSNVPESFTKQKLQQFFPEANDVRLLLTRTGVSKRIAYVEYADEQKCQHFYDSLPGNEQVKKIILENGHFIKVEMSNPQKAQEKKTLKQLTQFVPHQLKQQSSTMTNEDFRKLL